MVLCWLLAFLLVLQHLTEILFVYFVIFLLLCQNKMSSVTFGDKKANHFYEAK